MASLIRSWRELDLAKTAHGWGPLWLPLLHKPNSACHLQRLATTNVMSRANMSSFRSFSEPEAKSSLERAGFYLIKDNDEGRTDSEDFTGKGKLFAQFYDAGYYTKTPQGLEFIFQNTWGDTVRFREALCLFPFKSSNLRSNTVGNTFNLAIHHRTTSLGLYEIL